MNKTACVEYLISERNKKRVGAGVRTAEYFKITRQYVSLIYKEYKEYIDSKLLPEPEKTFVCKVCGYTIKMSKKSLIRNCCVSCEKENKYFCKKHGVYTASGKVKRCMQCFSVFVTKRYQRIKEEGGERYEALKAGWRKSQAIWRQAHPDKLREINKNKMEEIKNDPIKHEKYLERHRGYYAKKFEAV